MSKRVSLYLGVPLGLVPSLNLILPKSPERGSLSTLAAPVAFKIPSKAVPPPRKVVKATAASFLRYGLPDKSILPNCLGNCKRDSWVLGENKKAAITGANRSKAKGKSPRPEDRFINLARERKSASFAPCASIASLPALKALNLKLFRYVIKARSDLLINGNASAIFEI